MPTDIPVCPLLFLLSHQSQRSPITNLDAAREKQVPPAAVHITEKQSATATAKSLQSCLTLCDPIDGSPPGSSVPGILQARTLEWVLEKGLP